MTREVLADRVRSISYIAAMPPAERERLAAEVHRARRPAPGAVRPPVRVPRPVVPPALTDERRAAVLGWWSGQRRDLPWRRTRDPWAVLVCEVMPQQTQVARVAERWRPFLDRFPTPAALAAAPVGRGRPLVDRARLQPPRARTCTAARRRSSSDHDGRLPDDLRGAARAARRSARTPPARCWPSPSSATTASSTPTRPGCWPGGRASALRPAEAQAAADAAVPAGPGVGVEPGDARPRRRRSAAGAPRGATTARSPAVRVGAAGLRRRPIPPTARPACRGGQSRFEGSDRQGRGRLVEALRHGDGAGRRPRRGRWAGPTIPTGPRGSPRRSSPTASSRSTPAAYRLA